ncbi:nose resistant to fluoxetine protein 6-like [Amblyomma americanum]
MTVPTFFMIMCIYILPLIASGPNSKEFYNRFYAEIRAVWWDFLLLVRNWKEDDIIPILPHLWYLSTDFQLFLVSVIVIQAFKAKKALVVALFGLLSFVFCVISAWQVYDARIPPFMIALTQSYSLYLDQSNKYYKLPFYHGVCFFSGCITFLFVQKYRHRRISNIFQAACWCVALFCGLFCLFVRHAWYSRDGRAPEPTRMFYAFADRILWSVCLAWFVFACTTRKAEPLRCMLSWQGLLPLSRLSFGVYLLHSPIQMLSFHIARERTFFSHYTLVSASFAVLIWSYVLSYVMFIVCEGPTTNLETLLFTGPRRRQNEGKSAEAPASQADQKKLQLSFDNAMAFCETEDCCVAGKVCRL